MLGGGFMGRVHSRAARSAGAVLDSVASSRPERSAQAAAELGFENSTASDALLGRTLDAIHICTPNDVHAAQSLQALDAGSNIICEKPLATDSTAARAVLARADEAGLLGTVPFVYRYHPMVREARARFREGQAGTLLTVDAGYLQDWLLGSGDENWRVDSERGGPSRAFADVGSHLVDLIEFIVDDRISSLVATTRTVHPRRGGTVVTTEDTVAVTVEFSGGAIGSLLVSQLAPGRKNGLTVEIAGTEASMRFEQERPEQLWFGKRADSRLLVRDPDSLSADAAPVHGPGRPSAGIPGRVQWLCRRLLCLLRWRATGGAADSARRGASRARDGGRAAVGTRTFLGRCRVAGRLGTATSRTMSARPPEP